MKKIRWQAEKVIDTEIGPLRCYARMSRSEIVVRIEKDGDTSAFAEWGMPKCMGLTAAMHQAAIQTDAETIRPFKVYTHPAGIEEIRRTAEALGYMLCRWEPIAKGIPDYNARDSYGNVVCFGDAGEYEVPEHTNERAYDLMDYWLSGLTPPKDPT